MSVSRTKLTPAAGGVAYNPGDLFHMPNQGDFGPRTRDNHVGIDYGAPAGTSIPAASTGEVVYSGPSQGLAGRAGTVIDTQFRIHKLSFIG